MKNDMPEPNMDAFTEEEMEQLSSKFPTQKCQVMEKLRQLEEEKQCLIKHFVELIHEYSKHSNGCMIKAADYFLANIRTDANPFIIGIANEAANIVKNIHWFK